MRHLITGGAGFIGSHLAELLLNRGDEVVVLDDLSTGRIQNIAHLKGHDNFDYVVDTVMNEPLLGELVDGADVVYHLAAAVGVKLIVESPVRTLETNIHGTEIVLKWANKKKKKVFFASTSEVYGKSTAMPFREDSDIVLGATSIGRWAYACSKAVDEFLALAYAREKGLPVVVGRFFNTVGPRQVGLYGMVVPTFVRQALMGHPITVFGDGKQRRSFTHVSDAVRAAADLMAHPGAVGRVFNIGSGEEISIGELALLAKEMTRSHSEIVQVSYARAYGDGFEDIERRLPNLEALSELVAYKPTKGMRDILADVIADLSA